MNIMELIDAYTDTMIGYGNPNARAAVVEAVEKLEKDAARYRWLRKYLPSDNTDCDDAIVAALTPEELDAVIDAAMKEATNGQGN